MSRLAFRAPVCDPRPRSAWLLVGVASATLWITGQLAVWAMALQATALLFSLATRRQPRPWQMDPWVLNLGMFGVVGGTIFQALAGHPATVNLAHFAALSQGLQLLDARPRRTEFLLVAMALFQVILAATLTDSVLFTPLLAAFLVSTTWTMLVHTLRTEAMEAGAIEAAPQALRGGLLTMTLGASMAALLMALVLFVALPRMHSSLLRTGIAGGHALAGFSDRVELGTIGRIRKDTRVVLRVETLQGTPPEPARAYWRGLAFDHFDGRRWSVSPTSGTRRRLPLPGSPRLGVDLAAPVGSHPRVQRITREPVNSGVVFALGRASRVVGPLNRLEVDPNGGLYAPGQENDRVRYTVWSDPDAWSDEALRADRSVAPSGAAAVGKAGADRYLGLPTLDARVKQLAVQLTGGLESDADRAHSLERALRALGSYTDEPPDLGGDSRSPVERFLLGDLAGHCEYFASGMVILARSVGLHARLVNGFAGGRENAIAGFVELIASDAHAWVEIHFERAGWVRYDPTPPDLRLRASAAPGLWERLADLGSAVELWWFDRVVDFDASDQARGLRGMLRAWQSWRADTHPQADRGPAWAPSAGLPWRDLALGGIAVSLAALWVRRRGRRRCLPGRGPYRRALRQLARRGLTRAPQVTAREFVREVATRLPRAEAPFRALTELYLAERFGNKNPIQAETYLKELQQCLTGKSGRLTAPR